jgi:mono/diheme cytochrome c family protein
MSSRSLRSVMIIAGVLFVAATAVLGGGGTGGYTFKTYCATCHGGDGKGDGQLAKLLTVKPTDLTQIAARNDGKFPTDDVRARIDGRQFVPPHGTSDMPVWGDAFSQSEQAGGQEAVKARIDELVEYLRGIQVSKVARRE